MRSAAPLGLIAWQLVLTEAVRAMHRYNDNPHSLSNIELLVPLMVSDDVVSVESDASDASAAGERYERARIDKDMPFSNIPASEFVLDENVPVSKKKKRGHKHSRKQDFAYWPRSVYLENVASGESDERGERSEVGELSAQMWRACRRLTRSTAARQHELLLLLCAELLDASPAPAALPAPFAPPDCPCCPQSGAPVWLGPDGPGGPRGPVGPGGPLGPTRRELVPIGEDPYLVKSYMRSRARKRRYRMSDLGSA